jgi:hypothetical protein
MFAQLKQHGTGEPIGGRQLVLVKINTAVRSNIRVQEIQGASCIFPTLGQADAIAMTIRMHSE